MDTLLSIPQTVSLSKMHFALVPLSYFKLASGFHWLSEPKQLGGGSPCSQSSEGFRGTPSSHCPTNCLWYNAMPSKTWLLPLCLPVIISSFLPFLHVVVAKLNTTSSLERSMFSTSKSTHVLFPWSVIPIYLPTLMSASCLLCKCLFLFPTAAQTPTSLGGLARYSWP